MQGRSIGSRRFVVGSPAPQPTRASIYQEEPTPHDWTAPNDLHAQLAPPRRRAELHARALRHGLIASQLGLPMRARDEEQTLEPWPEEPPEQAAYAAYGGDDQLFNEQTTNYDEWELQKELVTYEQTYGGYDPAYDDYPALDLQLPPVASAYEPEYAHAEPFEEPQPAYAQPEVSAPGSYPFAQVGRDSLPSGAAAKWQSEHAIRRVGAATLQPAPPLQRASAPAQVEARRASVAPARVATPVRVVDDEPVAYPHNRSWSKRLLFVLVLAGAGYAAHEYYLGRPAAVAPALPIPPPPAAEVTTSEPAAPSAEPAVVAAPTTPQESAKARRSAARAALIAERRRERRAARRGRSDESSASDARHDDPAPQRSQPYASAQEEYVNARHAGAQTGVLRINSLPWSQVYVDGQLAGHTPQMNLQLAAGKHRVTLVNEDMQLSKTIAVQISAGGVTTHTINLAD